VIYKDSCAVCGANSSVARDAVVELIVRNMKQSGGFSVNGVGAFWTQYDVVLCDDCQWRLGNLSSAKRDALKMLTEAVKLDSKNAAAKKNLETLKKML